uniref:Uncharacterized protein n=1 Tax=Rhizophora mucronata TaxID=61149 RepID=A0A2P2NWM5_RHIMU
MQHNCVSSTKLNNYEKYVRVRLRLLVYLTHQRTLATQQVFSGEISKSHSRPSHTASDAIKPACPNNHVMHFAFKSNHGMKVPSSFYL